MNDYVLSRRTFRRYNMLTKQHPPCVLQLSIRLRAHKRMGDKHASTNHNGGCWFLFVLGPPFPLFGLSEHRERGGGGPFRMSPSKGEIISSDQSL